MPGPGVPGPGVPGPGAGGSFAVRLRHIAARRPHADIAMATVLFAVTLITTVGGPAQQRARLTGVAVAAAAVACAALAARRYRPVLALLVSICAAEVYLALFQGNEGTLILAVPLIAIFTVVEATGRRTALSAGVLAVLAMAGAHMLIKPSSWLGAENVALAALGGLAVAAGSASRHRRAYLAEIEQRARRAESDRQLEARRQVVQERLRIARDLHDAVGHSLALITVQASAAAQLLDERPAAAREALGHIRQASRNALTELSDTIGLLRDPDQNAAPVEPAAGLSGLSELLAAFRRSGLEVREEVDGTVRPLPPWVDLAAYRMIQESLTNVAKHAGVPLARLRLEYAPDLLRIVVEDHGRGCPAWPGNTGSGDTGSGDTGSGDTGSGDTGSGDTGLGLVGMRERVGALGGTLQAGPGAGGGFRVTADLPLRPSAGVTG